MSKNANNVLIHTANRIPIIIAAELMRLFQEHPEALWLLERAHELDPEGVHL